MKDRLLHYLRNCCESALHELYPAGIPKKVSQRFEREINYLSEKPDCHDDFLLFKELSDAVRRACGKLHLGGTISNSILIYLLGDLELNPMPAHYYCPHCGYYHEQPEAVAGLDLPEEKCPHCKTVLRRDGFSLREEYVWKASSGMTFEYRMTSRVIPLARKVIERHYAGQHRHTALLGWQSSEKITASGVVIFPAEKSLADYSEHIGITCDGEDCLCHDWRLFEQGDLKKVLLLSIDWLDRLDDLQWETGILNDSMIPESLSDISCQDILNVSVLSQDEFGVFCRQRPATFREKVNLLAAAHNTYKAEDSDSSLAYFERLLDDPLLLSCPIYTRDDAFDMLRSIYKDADRAFLDAENMRKGKFCDGRCEFDPAAPDAVRDLAQHIAYLFPRVHIQWYALQYMRLAKYLKLDRRAYCKVMRSRE